MTYPDWARTLAATAALALGVTLPALALAGKADVLGVQMVRTGTGVYRVTVTVQHDDTGWAHYADKWDVVAPDGTVLGTRTLLHPHETEQPFTRSLSDVAIPESIEHVIVRAHDKVDGYGGLEVKVQMKDAK